MKVYILEESYEYEGDTLFGVFTTKEKAEVALNKLLEPDEEYRRRYFCIHEIETDETYDN